MGLLDWMKKKNVEKKTEEVSSLEKTGTGAKPASLSAPTEKPVSAEEAAEKIMVLIPYIRQYRSQGMNEEEIVSFLKEHEWPEPLVRKALKYA